MDEAMRVASGADPRLSNAEVATFVKDRVDIHLGYILMMRSLRASTDPLVLMPLRVRKGLAALIGEELLETIWESDGWHR